MRHAGGRACSQRAARKTCMQTPCSMQPTAAHSTPPCKGLTELSKHLLPVGCISARRGRGGSKSLRLRVAILWGLTGSRRRHASSCSGQASAVDGSMSCRCNWLVARRERGSVSFLAGTGTNEGACLPTPKPSVHSPTQTPPMRGAFLVELHAF